MITSLYNLIKENLLYADMANFGLVFASQNMPRMPKPYIVMNVLNIAMPDHVLYSHEINAQGYRDVAAWRMATVELQVYNGLDSLDAVSKLALVMQTEPSLQSQDKLNCAIGARLFMAYMPEMLNNSQFEGRAVYHFQYFYSEGTTDDVGLIETVEIEGTYTGTGTDIIDDDGNVIGSPITCHEVISVQIPYDATDWDDDTTEWDDVSTTWDEVVHYGTIGEIQPHG